MSSNEALSFLVTGSRGVLGKQICKILRESPLNHRVTTFPGDINDRHFVRNFMTSSRSFTHLIHAAAIVPTSAVSSNLTRAYQTNVMGTENIITEFLTANSGCHVNYISSSHVYGNSQKAILEVTPPEPLGSYGRTKLAGEFVASDVTLSLKGQICIPRLFSLYSDEQFGSFLLPSLKEKLDASGPERKVEIFGWNNIRDFSTAEFHARAVAHLSSNSLIGVFNVGSGKGQSILSFAKSQFQFNLINKDLTMDPSATSVIADTSKLLSTGFSIE